MSRPTEVKLMKHTPRMVCLCFNHINFALKLTALGQMFSCFERDHVVEKDGEKNVDALLRNITYPVTLSDWKLIQIETG